MDVFKLLIRSTNLQKSTIAAKKASDQRIPSAGVPSHPQVLCENTVSPPTKVSRYPSIGPGEERKRKRDDVKDNALNGAEDDFDFFGNHAIPKPPSSVNPEKPRGKAEDETATGISFERLSEDECRKLMKAHKLKVTLLEDHAEAEHTKKKRRKDPVVPPPPKKDAFTQLFSQPLTSFRELRGKYGISKRLTKNLSAEGYTIPTEVQMGALPLLLGSDEDRGLRPKSSKHRKLHQRSDIDLLTVAPTGSGKTLAFLIPTLHGLLQARHANEGKSTKKQEEHQVKAIIIAPTHELADQIVNEGKKLAVGTGIRVTGMRKGMVMYQAHEKSSQSNGNGAGNVSTSKTLGEPSGGTYLVKSDILVSTPLMLLHALAPAEDDSDPLPLPSVQYLVLDEADVLLDPLFRTQTLAIWSVCTSPSLQTSLWSATIGSSIESLAQIYISSRRQTLQLPKTSNHHLLRLIVGLKDSALPTISHRLIYAGTEQGKLLAIRQLLHPTASSPQDPNPTLRPPFLIFTQTIRRAIALHSELLYDIPPEAGGSTRIAVLHADLSDTARAAIMTGFRQGEIWVLITTDLLSRGVDFRGVNGVVNYDIPSTGASYVHRAGRTGRAGREGGVAVTLYTKEDIPYVKNVANVIAASQKTKAKSTTAASQGIEGGNQEGVQKWLLDALPKVSKKTKSELKRRGVESRRTVPNLGKEDVGLGLGLGGRRRDGGVTGKERKGNGKGRGKSRDRISTKSGFDRKLENRRKGAIRGVRAQRERETERETERHGDGNGDGNGEDWAGFED
ncbi:MAG: hypothetical protein Q9187_006828 [Circinaria calcarea]